VTVQPDGPRAGTNPPAAPAAPLVAQHSVATAIREIAGGRAIVVIDDVARENEGDLIFAAELATTELVAFMMTQCRGIICAPMQGADLDRLELPPMVVNNTDRHGTAFSVSVDARDGITTGVSAADRAHTIRLLGSSTTQADDLSRPGHVFPLRSAPGGVLERPGHTEAAVDLALLAGLSPAAAICEIANEDGSMARLEDLAAFAHLHGLSMITIADLVDYRSQPPGRNAEF
jgi:3,4-dihydroxy 2-butanone 4-phosphate synthase / GTP cyclohydrolase II